MYSTYTLTSTIVNNNNYKIADNITDYKYPYFRVSVRGRYKGQLSRLPIALEITRKTIKSGR